MADCAIDGRLPEKNLVTPQQAAMEAVKWLERSERGEVSTVIREESKCRTNSSSDRTTYNKIWRLH